MAAPLYPKTGVSAFRLPHGLFFSRWSMHSENEKAIYVNMLDISSLPGINEYDGKFFFIYYMKNESMVKSFLIC